MSISFAMSGPRVAAVAVAAGLSLTLAGCGGSAKKSDQAGAAMSQPSAAADAGSATFGNGPSTIATARKATVNIYQNAGDSTPNLQLHNPNPDGAPRVFLVVGRKPGWLHVLLPVAPNGSEGWIAQNEVVTNTTTYWVQVLRSAHHLHVYKGKRLLINAPAAIGSTDTPTPGGRYYLTELLQAPDPKGAYGPYAFGLSGYSTSLKQFNGHDPIIGIHGTNEPKLVGTSVSHGCVRLNNSVITRLAKMLPLGTPVQITT
jgi:lipoprotein-anchoring transpeptidase ErfK/SrfK